MKVVVQLLLTLLLNASWQAVLVVGFAALCDWLLRGTTARYRHGVWVAALFLALALPLLSSTDLIETLRSSSARPQLAETSSAPKFVTRVSSPDLDSLEAPAAESKTPVSPVAPARRASAIHVNGILATILIALYGLFLSFRAGQLIRAWRRTRVIKQSALTFESWTVEAIVRRCQKAIGVNRVRILCSPSVPVPITVGILNPVIVLPERLLQDFDEEVLTTAIGHELVHVCRRDYLANLVYELIYLPLSFHPAIALLRRHIKQTRELCCDELVANKLLKAETYARSLVRLVGTAPLGRRPAADTTIGISEADILEVRIMSLLKAPKLTARRKRLLLIAALLLLVAPCVAATSFGLTFNIDRQEPSVPPPPPAKSEALNQDQARAELRRAVQQLEELKRTAPQSQWADIEARLREAKQKLKEAEQQRPGAEARLREVQQNLEDNERLLQQYNQQKRETDEQKLEELKTMLARMEQQKPADEARTKEVREKIAEIERLYSFDRDIQRSMDLQQKLGTDRKARVIYRVDPEYPADAREKKITGKVLLALTIDHEGLPQNIQVKRSLYPSLDQSAVECVRKWRFEPAIKDGQPVSMFINVEVEFGVESGNPDQRKQLEDQAKREAAELDATLARRQEYEMKRRKEMEDQGSEERARRQAELTRGAVLSMDRAIQIATSQVPGKVLACSLGRDGDKLFYHVIIINGDGDKSTATYVWVSAIDGQILKTEKEEPRKEEAANESAPRARINGGVLNSKAASLPQPTYPAIARSAHASGEVTVEVTIDESGNVIAAHAVSGHPLLQAAAVAAAREASFSPTRLQGEPVKVAGVLIYKFEAQ